MTLLYSERLKCVPNLRAASLPPCCGNCENFSDYDLTGDEASRCDKFDVAVEFYNLCDDYVKEGAR